MLSGSVCKKAILQSLKQLAVQLTLWHTPDALNPSTEQHTQALTTVNYCGNVSLYNSPGPLGGLLGFPGGSDSKESACKMGETQVQSLCWEDPLEKAMATHSSILAWRVPWTEEPGRGHKDPMWTQLTDDDY